MAGVHDADIARGVVVRIGEVDDRAVVNHQGGIAVIEDARSGDGGGSAPVHMIGAVGMPDVAALLIKDAVGPYHPDLACGGDVEDGHMAAPVAGAAADHPVGAP